MVIKVSAVRSCPEILEPARRQLGVSHRVLDVAVAEVSLQRPRIVALVRQRKTAGVAQHVWVSLELEASRRTTSSDPPITDSDPAIQPIMGGGPQSWATVPVAFLAAF
jgi:hypothetical protein